MEFLQEAASGGPTFSFCLTLILMSSFFRLQTNQVLNCAMQIPFFSASRFTIPLVRSMLAGTNLLIFYTLTELKLKDIETELNARREEKYDLQRQIYRTDARGTFTYANEFMPQQSGQLESQVP